MISDATTGVVLDGESMPFIDLTAARELRKLSVDLSRRGITLALARNIGQVRDVFAAVEPEVDHPRMYSTVEDAVRSLEAAAPPNS